MKFLRQLLKSWYAVDRIRIAPTTGRLLSLQTDDYILVQQQLYRVTRRELRNDADGDRLNYQLSDGRQTCTLTVLRPAESYRVQAELCQDAATVPVFDEDITTVDSAAGKRALLESGNDRPTEGFADL